MKKNKQGITLVEIIIYMGLLSIFIMALTNIFYGAISMKLESESQSAIQTDAQYILAKMGRDIAESTSLTTNGTSLLLSSGTYSLSGDNLVKTEGGVSTSLNGLDSKINSIEFTRLANTGGVPTVQVLFEIESKIIRSGNRTDLENYQVTFGMR